MRAIDFVLNQTEKAAENLFKAARKMPDDKLNWKPLDEGRDVIDLAAECALCPLWPIALLEKETFEMTPELMAEFERQKSELKTLDQSEKTFKENMAKFRAVASSFPENKLQETINLPWTSMTKAEVIAIPMSNITYHVGQVNYIQTLYGDKSWN